MNEFELMLNGPMAMAHTKKEARQRLAYLCFLAQRSGIGFDEFAAHPEIVRFSKEADIENELEHFVYFYRT